jgi:hypothetical protein
VKDLLPKDLGKPFQLLGVAEGIAKQIEHIPFSDPHIVGIENYCPNNK